MSNQWIRKGDKVVVLSGNDRGRTGVVLRRLGDRIVVEGMNLCKRHTKAKRQGMRPGIFEVERPLHASNIAIAAADGKPVRLKVRVNTAGEKELFYSHGGEEVVHRRIVKQSAEAK